jgi:aspartyl-tRNA synthetase
MTDNFGERTDYCGDLRKAHRGREVTLYGWVKRQRDLGNIVFLDLRDRTGVVQAVVDGDFPGLLERAKKIRMEYVVGLRGRVRERDGEMKNPRMETGEVEVSVTEMCLLNTSEVPPFLVSEEEQASEELKLKYRYLDLRRPPMQHNIKLRHDTALAVRNFLSGQGFYEIETPFLTRSTPEGARDYLVPSRIYKSRFFALPQSPQIFKQILMIAGYDRYFQIVRCFRDEDLRADRQPEFTQIDMEMSFVGREEIFSVVENMMAAIFKVIGVDINPPFPRMTYKESLERYGTDKPDLRFGLEIRDFTSLAGGLGSDIITGVCERGGRLKGLLAPGQGGLSRSQLDKLNEKARQLGGKGLIWIKKQEAGFKSSLRLDEAAFLVLWEEAGAAEDDLLLLIADDREKALRVLGDLRLDFRPSAVAKEGAYRLAWITDFPLFEWSEEENRPVSMHHPFTAPLSEDLDQLESDPLKVRAKAYDLVLNGTEIGGGSIRMHDLETQRRVFRALGLGEEEFQEKFGFFLEALRYGAPPHGGIAMGFDRIVMLLAGKDSIREVIPFPKTTSSLCLMTGAPAAVGQRQMTELGLKLLDPEEKPGS